MKAVTCRLTWLTSRKRVRRTLRVATPHKRETRREKGCLTLRLSPGSVTRPPSLVCLRWGFSFSALHGAFSGRGSQRAPSRELAFRYLHCTASCTGSGDQPEQGCLRRGRHFCQCAHEACCASKRHGSRGSRPLCFRVFLFVPSFSLLPPYVYSIWSIFPACVDVFFPLFYAVRFPFLCTSSTSSCRSMARDPPHRASCPGGPLQVRSASFPVNCLHGLVETTHSLPLLQTCPQEDGFAALNLLAALDAVSSLKRRSLSRVARSKE